VTEGGGLEVDGDGLEVENDVLVPKNGVLEPKDVLEAKDDLDLEIEVVKDEGEAVFLGNVKDVDELVEITNPGGAVGGREIASKTACIPPPGFATQVNGGSVFIDAVGTNTTPIIST
jgi:hypothetical protein